MPRRPISKQRKKPRHTVTLPRLLLLYTTSVGGLGGRRGADWKIGAP